jgi:hypothetical protein
MSLASKNLLSFVLNTNAGAPYLAVEVFYRGFCHMEALCEMWEIHRSSPETYKPRAAEIV